MSVGLLGAACFGTASIVARLAAQRLGSLRTTFLAQGAGLLLLLLCWPVAARVFVPRADAFWASLLPGVVLGAIGAAGSLANYQALICGPVLLVSPIVASQGLVTVTLSVVILHQRLIGVEALALGGILVGVVGTTINLHALTTLRQVSSTPERSRGIGWALLAMLCFGGQLFGLGVVSPHLGWFLPVWSARGVSVLLLGVFLVCQPVTFPLNRNTSTTPPLHDAHGTATPPRRHRTLRGYSWLAACAGLFNVVGLLAYSLEVQRGATGVAAALQSCSVLLPMAFGALALRERPAVSQVIGAGCVIGGLVLLGLVKP